MRKLIVPMVVVAAVAGGVLGCKGAKSPAAPAASTSPYSPTPPAAGRPSELDLAGLAARFGAIGAGVLQQTLPSSGGTSGVQAGPSGSGATRHAWLRALGTPAGASTVSAAFLCCSDTATTNLLVTGSVGGGASGSVPVALVYSSDGPLQWVGASGGAWDLSFQTNRINLTGTLNATGGTIGANQQLSITGTLEAVIRGGSTVDFLVVPIALTFTFPDLGAPPTSAAGSVVPPTATGNIGSLQISGTALPTINTASRCSRPQEGCGPLVNGPCPCTLWPVCPIYGIRCGP